jgi:hypothetical protein
MKVRLKVGDLVNNTHALDRSGMGLIVKIRVSSTSNDHTPYLVHWVTPPKGCPDYSWNSINWLERIDG